LLGKFMFAAVWRFRVAFASEKELRLNIKSRR
jgi:hypothetical protein